MNTTKESPQGTNRKTASVVGVLFIIGTVSGLLMFPFITILNTPDHLSTIATHEGQMIIATLLKFIMGVACAGVGLALYPILKKYNEGLAIGAAGFRIIEGVIGIVGAVGYVALLALSQEFVKAGAPALSFYQTADVLINTTASWLRDVAVLLTWCIGALMYYSIFYQHKLVPRWLTSLGSGWNHINQHQLYVGDVSYHPDCRDNSGDSQSADIGTGVGTGGMADRYRI